ncbi:DUF4231 domain-containing protein [Mycoplasma todarodis]|uniref:DUF4231 domain-containing protein n=1 Tax=Mycoplasma todarodis TaxID=1937191 RepID=A0A4R0XJ66_9MOLU|nr:DUF4231 domain-containing protein [Mycoplasma todarodis]TCG10454.1 hypothetical protein C4B25_04150 [Mycoplasma todarodis]
MSKKVIKSIYHLHDTPMEYVEARRKHSKRDLIIFRQLFIWLNVAIAIAAATMAILTALIFSLLLFGGKKPAWFFFMVTGVSATTTMLTSFINFFVIKGKYQEAMRVNRRIRGQITLYINKAGFYSEDAKNREILLYTRVAQICGNYDAIGETDDTVKEIEELVKNTKKRSKDAKK